jgi:hypothetical protein
MGAIVYGDEIDRMPLLQRGRWFRQLATSHATLVIGTHLDLRRFGQLCGFDVITHRLAPLHRHTLVEVVNRRLQSMATGEQSIPRFTAAEFDIIMTESRGVPGEANVVCHRLLAERVA